MVRAQTSLIVNKTKRKSHSSQIKPYLKTLSSSKAAWNGIIVEHNIDLATETH
ncbi:hypothetical protein NIES4071_35840 [Calothrix sp. NIES-4071]|nr:hypothetical protein NIES4071_35840 [Calothrix sp. NIES-4071]BAZ57903.1 hypothetical protein NIES4105_35770 [Calothrix sp. NIES-4105]